MPKAINWEFESEDYEFQQEQKAKEKREQEAKAKRILNRKIKAIQLSIDVAIAKKKGDTSKYCDNGANKFSPGLFFDHFSLQFYSGQSCLAIGGDTYQITLYDPTHEELLLILKMAKKSLEE